MFRHNGIVWIHVLAILGIVHIRDATAFTTPSLHHPYAAATFRQSSFQLHSTVIERTEEKTVEILKDDKVEEEQKYGGEAYEIRLWNDPFNKREFVARCLSTICGKSDTESYQIMMEAHNNGMGVIGRYNLEVAELYFSSLKESGLTIDMIQVDDD